MIVKIDDDLNFIRKYCPIKGNISNQMIVKIDDDLNLTRKYCPIKGNIDQTRIIQFHSSLKLYGSKVYTISMTQVVLDLSNSSFINAGFWFT